MIKKRNEKSFFYFQIQNHSIKMTNISHLSKWLVSGDLSKQIAISLNFFIIGWKRSICRDIKKNVNNDLPNYERSSFNEWRNNNLFNKNSNLDMQLHDKGNIFVVLNKKTDQNEAKEQINRSSLKTLNHDT